MDHGEGRQLPAGHLPYSVANAITQHPSTNPLIRPEGLGESFLTW